MFLRSFFTKFNTPSIYYFYFAILLIAVCDFVFFIKTEQFTLGIFGAIACTGLLLLPMFLFTKKYACIFLYYHQFLFLFHSI